MVPIADVIDATHLEQLHRWHSDPQQAGGGNAQPPPSGLLLARTEVSIKVIRTALAAPDLPDRHRTDPYSVTATDGSHGLWLVQRKQGV